MLSAAKHLPAKTAVAIPAKALPSPPAKGDNRGSVIPTNAGIYPRLPAVLPARGIVKHLPRPRHSRESGNPEHPPCPKGGPAGVVILSISEESTHKIFCISTILRVHNGPLFGIKGYGGGCLGVTTVVRTDPLLKLPTGGPSMPRQPELTSHRSFRLSTPTPRPVEPHWLTTRRLARSAVIVAGAGVVVGLTIFLFLSAPPRPALAVPDPCYPPSPQPGAARPWEVGIDVSTYSEVNTRNGNLFTAIPVVSWSGIGPDMSMSLYHNSAAVADDHHFYNAVGFSLGEGWSMSYSDRLLLDALPLTNEITLVRADGSLDEFTWNAAQQRWLGPPGVYDVIIGVSQDAWRVKHKNQSYHEFRRFEETDTFARLEKVVDATGNTATVTYEAGPTELCGIGNVRLKEVQAGGRLLEFKYESGPCDVLTRILDERDEPGEPEPGEPADRSWTFEYQSGRMSKFTGPRNKPIDLTYYLNGWIATISDRHDAGPSYPTWTYNYTDSRATQIYDPAGDGGGLLQEFDFTCSGPSQSERKTITEYTDRRGHERFYWYPEPAPLAIPMNYATLERIEEPAGTQYFNFSGGRDLLWYSDAVYNQWESTYDTRGNQLTLTDSLSHVQTWTYDPLNNLTSYTDAAGNTVRFYYDDIAYPTLLTRIVEPSDSANPPPGQLPGQEGAFPTTRLTYYVTTASSCGTVLESGNRACHGQAESVTDPNNVWTGFEYDQWGQQAKYIEGRWPSQVAGVSWNYGNWHAMTLGSDGNGQGNSGSGGPGGYGGNDPDGNPTTSGCEVWATSGGPEQTWPPFPLPPTPNLPRRTAQFFDSPSDPDAKYTARNQLEQLRLHLDDGKTRTHTAQYDVMGRQKQANVVSNEAGGGDVTRTFNYGYNVAAGTYTRTGPDGDVTTMQMDWADHLEYVERKTSSGTLLMRADYTHFANGNVESITYKKPDGTPAASIHYFYDSANRLTFIEHRNVLLQAFLRMEYTYYSNDLPHEIIEKDNLAGTWNIRATTTFIYDRRNRLINESRTQQNAYEREYAYDKGGNRTRKYDSLAGREVWYHYDVDEYADPDVYKSRNNRLMYEELKDSATMDPISTKYYEYTADGNVTRVITKESAAVYQQSAMSGGPSLSATSGTAAPTAGAVGATGPGGGGTSMLMGGGLGMAYSAVRFVYANNGRTATFVHDESWTWDESSAPENYTINWAREFRYDGARARYMNRPLDVDTLGLNPQPHPTQATVWTDYDGDQAYSDFGGSTEKYEPGLWRRSAAGVVDYLHNDHLGTLRRTSNSSGAAGASDVYTAFGERISGTYDRFGYVGAFGYQSHSELPFLHVGARYYDPGSGRFLQRDPIGIEGGSNVYEYVKGSATIAIDPDGQILWLPIVIGAIIFIDVLADPAEAPSPDDTQAEMQRRQRKMREDAKWRAAARFIPYGLLCRSASKGAGSALSKIGPSPNPPPFVSPFPPMPKGPFIGGGKLYEHY